MLKLLILYCFFFFVVVVGFSIAAPTEQSDYDDDFQKDTPASNPIITTKPQEIIANIGDIVALPCTVEGNTSKHLNTRLIMN